MGTGADSSEITLTTDVSAHGVPLVGRAALLGAIDSRLRTGGGVVLTGPSGIGKTAILDAVASAALQRGERVLRLTATVAERFLPYAGMAELLAQVPDEVVARLPGPQRAAFDTMLVRRGDSRGRGGRAELARRLAWQACLESAAEPVLLIIDDAQWLDGASADVIGYASRRLADRPVRAVIAQRSPDSPAVRTRVMHLSPAPVQELTVPPLTSEDLTPLLDAHGLTYWAAARLHADSGGNPYLALALAGAFAFDDSPAGSTRTRLPEQVRAALVDRLDALPAAVRDTLFAAALATRPTAAQLRMTGRPDADRELRAAATAGLVSVDNGIVRFTPPAIAIVLAEEAPADRRSAMHRQLAATASDPVERIRHRALADEHPDTEIARSLVAAAETALQRGAPGLVADLYLLAADRTGGDLHSERIEWLVSAAEAAASASRREQCLQAGEAVLAADASPAQRVRARIAMLDAHGQQLGVMEEALSTALVEAGDDAALLAPLRLRLAWQRIHQGKTDQAELEAKAAVRLARRVGDTWVESMAGAIVAQVTRASGRADYLQVLAEALDVPAEEGRGMLNLTPRFLAVRFALFDDRLTEARTELLRMLPEAERSGLDELLDILRNLAEVASRDGHTRDALDYAYRAARLFQENELSLGPSWYTLAMAELAGGSPARALSYADRGVRSSETDVDMVYLARNLHVLGQALLTTGDNAAALTTLRRLQELEADRGTADPSTLRWHGDLVAALVNAGEAAAATEVVAEARDAAQRLKRSRGVLAELDRAEALILVHQGEAAAAATLATAAAQTFADLGQPIAQGSALLVLGRAERRRRRYAAARAAIEQAREIFSRAHATPWTQRAQRALVALTVGAQRRSPETLPESDAAPAPETTSASEAGLTTTEARIAALVRQGASNREIATQLYLSVKTVEATLTRIYRKVGVRSRTQLASRLTEG
ncbi:helix-turn-helix transcriptional regulator [Catenuloplanes japonicus]|uniref:helix-turn-helix transcriptional regulator n=1 Tax=Catenuloplanes japonicus TaxID=33876 RepID=UPI000B16E6FC|nr:LuxR family transcriptional regulator [Catenuloplanes japonicus]